MAIHYFLHSCSYLAQQWRKWVWTWARRVSSFGTWKQQLTRWLLHNYLHGSLAWHPMATMSSLGLSTKDAKSTSEKTAISDRALCSKKSSERHLFDISLLVSFSLMVCSISFRILRSQVEHVASIPNTAEGSADGPTCYELRVSPLHLVYIQVNSSMPGPLRGTAVVDMPYDAYSLFLMGVCM